MRAFAIGALGLVIVALAAVLLLSLGDDGDGDGDDRAALAALKKRDEREERQEQLERRLKKEIAEEKREQAIKEQGERASLEKKSGGGASASSGLDGFAELESSLPGEVGYAIGPPASPPGATGGSLETGSAWSTSKVPVVLRVVEEAGGPGGLSPTQQEEARSALTLSDNAAALSLWGDLEAAHGGSTGAAAAVGEVLREAGDSSTQVSSVGRDGFTPFGQTEWSLALQEQFMSYLAAGCIVSGEASEYVLDLMAEVSSDTWGLGSTGLPARWKGGWGPGTDGRYLARQMGTLEVGGGVAVVAIAALPDDGSFETAQQMATSVAGWLGERASQFAAAPAGC